MNNQQNEHDWPDALTDRGLTEILGGETPPDLSERILAAAKNDSAQTINLTDRATSNSATKRLGKVVAALFATAACLFVAAQLLLPGIQAARAPRDILARAERRDLRREELKEILTTDGQSKSAGELSEEESSEPKSDEEIYAELRRRAITAPRSGSRQLAEQRKTRTLYSPYYLQGDKDVSGDQSSAPIVYPESTEWEDLTARRKKYASVDLRGRGQRMRIDAAPGGNVDRYFGFHAVPGQYGPQWGIGPGTSGDKYTRINENPFITAIGEKAVSTFSIDVDTASYANVRQFLTSGQLPPPDAVRIEELLNYFTYDYSGPTDDTPFAANMEVAECPWNPEHRLARIAIKGKEIDNKARPLSNLVFLIDVSGSMNEPNKLPLVVEGMKQLTRELGENDKIAIVVYASSEGLALPSTRGDQQQTILSALDRLSAGGSTAGGAGINLAYSIAEQNFIKGGVNRVILCTDGDFNVGVTSTGDLERLAEQKAADTKVFLTVLGFGRGNLNDAMMEAISNRGNGNYHYVDNLTEARKVLVEEMTGTLVTIAKDVKIQVEFNPVKVAGYRLIGYENRMLATEDFNDDKKDAGEIGAGHTVTAVYEIVPAGKEVGTPSVDPLKYQSGPGGYGRGGYGGEYGRRGYGRGPAEPQPASEELLTLKLRYKLPDSDTSTKVEFPITDKGGSFEDATQDVRFAAAVASFGMLLRNSEHKGDATFDAVLEISQQAIGEDPHGYRAEFLELVRVANRLKP